MAASIHSGWSHCSKYTLRLESLQQVYTQAGVTAASIHSGWSHCSKYTLRLESLQQVYTQAGVTAASIHSGWSHCSKYTLRLESLQQMKQRAKDLGIPRYRYVCMVALGPSRNSTISMSSRCVWDHNVDTFAEHTYEKDGIFATAVIYCVYSE
ncbi:Tctex1 domain-containing protein 1 [Bulinus truncatus]|nr:Tctex1 domain-containing protein 1 [Bulinus truncatus]